jgi:hypothetical protein
MQIRDRPVFTEVYESSADFAPVDGSIYLYGESIEQRSHHVHGRMKVLPNVRSLAVEEERPFSIDVRVARDELVTVSLRSSRELDLLFRDTDANTVYIDVTGLRHHVWAPLLRSALGCVSNVIAVYVEPGDYRPSIRPTEGDIYDLSERITGIAPIPGFARLRDAGDNVCLVVLLGFEGTRAAYIIEQTQAPADNIVPVVGVPGFRLEYPFATFLGNRGPLIDTKAWKNVRFATANCPFSVFYALQDIEDRYPGHTLKIAPIGTKPHAIGAVLFAIIRGQNVELVYDHPVRKKERTTGTSRLLAYRVSVLCR